MSNFRLSAGQARFVYLFNGLAPVATSIVTPAVTWLQLQHKPLPEEQRKLLFIQECARQLVSCTIGLVTYFGGAMLTGKLMGKSPNKSLAQIVGGTVISFLGYGFLRPLVSTELIVRWLNSRTGKTVMGGEQSSATPPAAMPAGIDQRMQAFMQGQGQRFQGVPTASPMASRFSRTV